MLPREFDDLKLTGAFSVYSDEKSKGGQCVFDPSLTSIEVGDEDEDLDDFDEEEENDDVISLPRSLLFAKPGTSLPSLNFLLHSPTPAVKAWLTQIGYDPAESYRQLSNEVTRGYEKLFGETEVDRQPDNPYFAVLGGWPVEIYQWKHEWDVRQLVFTFQAAEPWIQVLADKNGTCTVAQIIT